MMIPGPVSTTMQLPSLYFRFKDSNKPKDPHRFQVREAYYPHWDGIHLRMKYDMRWYTLEDLDPISEEEYKQEIDNLRKKL